ncbi:hypothetical protein FZD47_25450 [Bacillus infantis]|uniref:Uncharacterized protein n=1 Tax=Bacillus infantis TaxID=324767 RepID=A0A5D4RWL1_9BACI|nr:hypothetical protein [Bacillus infantis]TYS55775.1 hypothetical protein FZD47_25450 [Bacillus infantis]
MEFFEVRAPYYALLKAEDFETAKAIYVKHVAEDDGTLSEEMHEVGKDYALAKFAQAPGENKKLIPIHEILNDFYCAEHEVLIIDGSLL